MSQSLPYLSIVTWMLITTCTSSATRATDDVVVSSTLMFIVSQSTCVSYLD